MAYGQKNKAKKPFSSDNIAAYYNYYSEYYDTTWYLEYNDATMHTEYHYSTSHSILKTKVHMIVNINLLQYSTT